MNNRLSAIMLSAILLAGRLATGADQPPRCSLWIDACQGEPTTYDAVLSDLASVQVIYLGERHTLQRHHDIQTRIVTDLAARGTRLVVALEQLESFQQPKIDEFNAGRFSFDQLAEATGWAQRWNNYRQYQPVLEAARKAGAWVIGLNARSETIRQVARSGGVAGLDPAARKELPVDMQLADPPYERLLTMVMQVHMAATPERLRPMIEAQIARDEAMAHTLAAFLQSDRGRGRMAIVLCGSGHVTYGLGTVSRVRRRLPESHERIILLSESGDVELSEAEKAVSRPIDITHQQLRDLARPVADYLHVTTLKSL